MHQNIIKITCEVKDLIDFSDLKPLQGKLKKLTKKNYRRLKKSIVDHGLNIPFFIWVNESESWILDGHQRRVVLKKMIESGEFFLKDNKVPVVKVHAKDRAEAKRQILSMVSQYGSITDEGMTDFLSDVDFDINEIASDFKLPDFDIETYIDSIGLGSVSAENKEILLQSLQSFQHKCPKCGFEWDEKK